MSSETKNKEHPTPEAVQVKRRPQPETEAETKKESQIETVPSLQAGSESELEAEPEKPNHIVFMISTGPRARESIFMVPVKDQYVTDDIIEHAEGFRCGEKSIVIGLQLLNLFGMRDSAESDGDDTRGKWSRYQITRACRSVSLDGIVLFSFIELVGEYQEK
jgi:hypothetical protein